MNGSEEPGKLETGNWKLEDGKWKPENGRSMGDDLPVSNFQFPFFPQAV
jgi:hypothetical protein